MLHSNHKKMDLELEFENNTEALKQEEINFICESKNGNLPFDMTGISCSNFKYRIYLESHSKFLLLKYLGRYLLCHFA